MSNLTPNVSHRIKKRIVSILNDLPEIPDGLKPKYLTDTFRIYDETEHSGHSTDTDIKTIIYLLCEERGIIISAYKPPMRRLMFFRAHMGTARPSVSTLIDLGLHRIDPDMTNSEFTTLRSRIAAAIYLAYRTEVTQKELSEIFNVSEVSIRDAMRERNVTHHSI